MAAKTKTIKRSELISGATPDQVYHALLNPKRHAEFTGAGATGNSRVGGKFTAFDGYIFGRHLELDPPGRIVQEWSTKEWPSGSSPSRIEWTFIAKKSGTRLSMVQSNVPATQAESYKKGWVDFYFDPMKKYFAAKASKPAAATVDRPKMN
jgi:activator of HSP90 ATPase